MNTLPDPLTPADCDLRDYQYMPLDVVRLRDSDIAAISTGDEFRTAVLLWCASWHQVPAASLPDDDIILSQLAGFGRVIREWKKIREGALRGWIKCNDGRLYHPVVAEKANESWDKKQTYHYNKLVDRTRKENKKREELKQPLVEILSIDDWKSIGMPINFPDKFQRKAKGIPAENTNDSEENPTENSLKVRKHKVREYIKPISPLITEGQTKGDEKPQSEHLKTQPTEPAHWVDYFNQQFGTDYGYKTQAQRRHIWPVLTRWCKDGYTVDKVSAAVKRAQDEATEPIVNLILYVDRVLASTQAKKSAPVQWWSTETGRKAKLEELGMKTRPGESNAALIARMQAEIDRRAAQ